MEALHYSIRRARLSKNLTQDFVAAELDITTRSYRKIENGEVSPTMERLGEIAKALEVNLAELLLPSNSAPPDKAKVVDAGQHEVSATNLAEAIRVQNELLSRLCGILESGTLAQPMLRGGG